MSESESPWRQRMTNDTEPLSDSWYRFTYTVKVPRSEDRSYAALQGEQKHALSTLTGNPDMVEALEGGEWIEVHPCWSTDHGRDLREGVVNGR